MILIRNTPFSNIINLCFFCVIFAISACSKENPKINNASTNSLNAVIDGKNFSAKHIEAIITLDKYVTILAIENQQALEVYARFKLGTTNYSADSLNRGAFVPDTSKFAWMESLEGNAVLSEIDTIKQTLSGNFTMKCNDLSNAQKVNIEKGSFYKVPYFKVPLLYKEGALNCYIDGQYYSSNVIVDYSSPFFANPGRINFKTENAPIMYFNSVFVQQINFGQSFEYQTNSGMEKQNGLAFYNIASINKGARLMVATFDATVNPQANQARHQITSGTFIVSY